MFPTPVVLIIYRRPELARQVFDVIRDIQPSELFVIADGPKDESETEVCQSTRRVVERIDWNCRLTTDFSDHNLGPRHRVVTGLEGVFRAVDRAIVLEDDCVPSPSFFEFCQQLLEYYAGDQRVWEIGGCNFQMGHSRTKASYYFSKYVHTWGWATWRRSWEKFDPDIESWPTLRNNGALGSVWASRAEEAYWTRVFDRVHDGRISTAWDFQWLYAMWCQGARSVVPDTNLISNVGFGHGASHHVDMDPALADLPRAEMVELRHPDCLTPVREADEFEFRRVYRGPFHGRAALLKRLLGFKD